jgi:xylan 1,4-beta-xylosidase
MLKQITVIPILLFLFLGTARGQNRTITIDVTKPKGTLNTTFNECVGAGRANEGLRADWQRQLRMAKEQLGFRYIRMHGILQDDMGVYFEDSAGKPIYNWQYIDELYDFLISIKVRPFVEFGFMPKALASKPTTLSFWFWKPNVSPPKDYDKWDGLITALVRHWTERYGQAEVKQWYFEVWNEPNLKNIFWASDQDEYFRLYKETASAVKAVSPDYRVGGPATAGNAWIPELISYCATNKVPVDFVSTHTYGNDSFIQKSDDEETATSKRKNAVSGDVKKSKMQIEGSSMPGLALHYTEWNSSSSFNDHLHDHYRQAAYILEKVKRIGDAAKSFSYWTFTDIFEEEGPRQTPFHGGFGLVNYQDIKKPAFYAYRYLNLLGKQELQNTDTCSWICRDKQGGIQVLLYDFTDKIFPSVADSKEFYSKIIPPKSKGKVGLVYKNLSPGKYTMNVYKTGYGLNDPYTSYLQMGAPSQLTKKEVELIKQKDNDSPIMSKTVVVTAQKLLEESFDLFENDVILVTFKKL